jgi:hypothetical protein
MVSIDAFEGDCPSPTSKAPPERLTPAGASVRCGTPDGFRQCRSEGTESRRRRSRSKPSSQRQQAGRRTAHSRRSPACSRTWWSPPPMPQPSLSLLSPFPLRLGFPEAQSRTFGDTPKYHPDRSAEIPIRYDLAFRLGVGTTPQRSTNSPVPTAFDNGHCSPRKLLRSVVARLLGRKPE